jgi:CDP-paratose 2-epimerase
MFWHYHQNPRQGEVYNAGGGINNSISIIEAITAINQICKEKISDWVDWDDYEIINDNRIGDHIYYVTNFNKFKSHYKW